MSAGGPRWRLVAADVAEVLVGLGATVVGLAAGALLTSTVEVGSWLGLVGAALVITAADVGLREPLRRFAAVGGAVVAVVLGLAAQLTIAYAALVLMPGIEVSSLGGVVATIVVAAVVMAAARWLWGAADSGYVVADVLDRASRARRRAGAAGVPVPTRSGLLVVQLDGVGAEVLREAVEAGLVPTIQRWLDSGTHRLDAWWARVPSTTPASQAGLLHGDSSPIPAFRWWDRDLGRLVVTNHPDDAALVEERLTTGDGLLAGGGTAISTMFSGDAATPLLVMSRTRAPGPDGRAPGIGPGEEYVRFFASPFVVARALVLTLGEIVKELYQGRRQRVRDVRPRIARRGWYVVLRGVTNVLMRDLNTALVSEALLRGDPTVYVDLVDYDEIAHHAGPSRPEALRALEGLDRSLRTFERVASLAPRAYRFVVLSDHGQALGETFHDRTGRSLTDTVRALMADPGAAARSSLGGEEWGPLNALLSSAPTLRRTPVVHGPDAAARRREPDGAPDLAVVASGNLGLVWFPQHPARLTLEDLAERWPGLVAGLAAQDGIGVVVVDSRDNGLVAVGSHGLVLLERPDADVQGEDPLAPFGPRARADLARAGRLENTGDLLLVSAVSPDGRVHAFEHQVGSHGGIGGRQNLALLVHPGEWLVDEDLLEEVDGRRLLVGAEAVHEQLVRWARRAGLRP